MVGLSSTAIESGAFEELAELVRSFEFKIKTDYLTLAWKTSTLKTMNNYFNSFSRHLPKFLVY